MKNSFVLFKGQGKEWVLQKEHEALKSLFEGTDLDGDGFVTLSDVKNCMEVSHVLEDYEIEKLFDLCDFGAKKKLNSECFTLL